MMKKNTSGLGKRYLKQPLRRMLTIVLVTAACELLIMVLLKISPIHNELLNPYVDTLLLLGLLTPVLYFLLIRPMDRYVDECQKAKEALFESNEHYRALTDVGEALIWTTDSKGNCNYLNQTWLNFTGRSLEQELEDGWMEGIHPDDLETFKNDFMIAIEQREKCSLKYRIRHKSGEYRWVQNNGAPMFTSKGAFTGYMGHCLDIHENIIAENYIKKREKEFRILFEYSPMPAVFWDLNGTILFWNKAAEQTFGLSKEEVTGQDITLYFKPDINTPEINYNLEETLATLGRKPLIKEFKRRDGRIILCEWNRTPIYGLDGKIRKIISVAKDITEQKRYEQQLIEAKEKAEESERLKSAFLANMSHELRSPLNSIIGFSELITDPTFELDQKMQFARLINSGGRNLLETITELMDYSKIEAGQVTVNRKPLSLPSLLHDLQLEYAYKAAEKGLQLSLSDHTLTYDIVVNSDEIKLRQVLVNFISNALKFTSQGSIELGISLMNDRVQLYVRDTGIGIAPEYQDKIFERFLQVETPLASKYGGIGLGLAISKSLIGMLGGTIGVESTKGVGSTFYFILPLQDAETQMPAPTTMMEENRTTLTA